ncbi:putative ankyrin repeat protein [Rosellinia necatrix]|uniref:Putative ankyrin repeat protein n=1 Tax=Rosellinia necatrix TaxID=77044 RepID=A0A1W2TNE0_ROSNE|nr:putative ankyrin repeat protein [Rosellinia necatrix]
MDPVSISGSVAGIVALAGTVFSLAVKYIKDVKDAPKDAKDLLGEVKQFSVLLHQLSLVARELEITTSPEQSSLQDSANLRFQHIYECQNVLNRVEVGLKKATKNLDSSSTRTKIQTHLLWPFSSGETKKIIESIQRQKQTINIALSANSYTRLALCLSNQEAASQRQEETSQRLGGIEDGVKKIIETDTKIFIDRQRREVLNFFGKFVNPWDEFERVQQLRHPMTGLWLTESTEFKDWIGMPGSRRWISGIPGAGKSVLAGLIIQECLKLSSVNVRKATTYFFCTYRDQATHSARNLISSLASQLARQDEEAFQILEEDHQELYSQKPLAAEPSLGRLLKSFERMCRLFDQVFVIVDGLDECDNDEILLTLLQLSLNKCSGSISMMLLGRDVVHIRDRLASDFNHTEVEAHTDDIQLYVLAELEGRIQSKKLRLRSQDLKDDIIAKLVHGAKGMFRWVSCQLDYLGELLTDRERRDALSELPPTLPATYERILMKADQSSASVRKLVQKTLLLIRANFCYLSYLLEALPIREDSDTLSTDDLVSEYDIMLNCSSLIRRSADGQKLEFSHFTVQEFLDGIDPTNTTLGFYHTSSPRAGNTLSQTCLRYLMLSDHAQKPRADMEYIESIRVRARTRPLYRYCSIKWVQCVAELSHEEKCDHTGVDDATLELIRALFDSRKSTSLCQWIIDYVDGRVSEYWQYLLLDLPNSAEDLTKSGIVGPWGFDIGAGVNIHDKVLRAPNSREKFDFVTFLTAVLRPSFTPLHMASMLGLPSLCDYLLKQGAKVNLKSDFGTPLHCALGGLDVFLCGDGFISRRPIGKFFSLGNNLRPPVIAQKKTVRLLLAAGARAAACFSTPFQRRTLMGLMHLSSRRMDPFHLVPDLVRAGLTIEAEDLNQMECWLRYNAEMPRLLDEPNERDTYVSLLKCLKSIDGKMDTTTRLYSIIYEFAKTHVFYGGDLTPEIAEVTDTSEDMLKSIIVNNDVMALEEILDNDDEDIQGLIKTVKFNIQGDEWTPVHLACNSGSADVLEMLLKMGIDADPTTPNGRKPIHLAIARNDGDILRILLRQGLSTLAKFSYQGTIWHWAAFQHGNAQVLRLLVTWAPDMDEALQVVSDLGQTPIGVALDRNNREATKLLVNHCRTAAFFKSYSPLYRLAAQLGCLEVVKKLIEVGIRPDGFDVKLGSPLHYIHPKASVPCVELLVEIFPHCYQQRDNGQIPFQSLLARAVHEDVEMNPQVFEVLLPACQDFEAKAMVSDIWPFFCSKALLYIPKDKSGVGWVEQTLAHLVEIGLIKTFEESCGVSVVVPFATELHKVISKHCPRWLTICQGQIHDDMRETVPILNNWKRISLILLKLASMTAYWDSASKDDFVTRLLYHAVLHEDRSLLGILLQKGVDVHQRVDAMSALELACLPVVGISEDTFECLLSYAKANRLNEHNQRLDGHTIVHFVGIRGGYHNSSPWKLEKIHDASVGLNAVTFHSLREPALVCHIREGSLATVEALLRLGANPWLADANGHNAAIGAILRNDTSILKLIDEQSKSRNLATIWDQTWKSPSESISGANAFHLAARTGSMDCMKLYMDEKWLTSLDSVDDSIQTPMHYAARYGQQSIIRFLHDHGCDVNSISRDGKSPLHLAAENGQLGAADELLGLGAEIKIDKHELSPLDYAYRTGNLELINTLKSRSKNAKFSMNQLKRKDIATMSDSFYHHLHKGDLDACEILITSGLSIDSEMRKPCPVTPLMLSLHERMPYMTVEWLLTKGAKVSIVFEKTDMQPYATALEAAIAEKDYHTLLPPLLRRYLQEGGDFSCLKQTPLLVAMERRNYKGLEIFLTELNQLSYNVKLVVNQRALICGKTALHWAADQDSINAATLLIDNGANLELTDFEGYTPLHYAARSGSIKVLELLIKLGACLEPLSSVKRRTPLMLACLFGHVEVLNRLLKFKQNINYDAFGMDLISITLSEADERPQLKICHSLFPRGFDLYRADLADISTIFYVMQSSNHWVLRHIIREYPLCVRIHEIQWSRFKLVQMAWDDIALANITKGYRLVHRCFGRGEPLKVSSSVSCGKDSLLYTAASRGPVTAVENLLSIGIDIETRVCEEGTALGVAIIYGQFDVVKYLVRRRANLAFGSDIGQDCAVMTPHRKMEILQWLLVDRYTDQPKITNVNSIAGEGARDTKGWLGIMQAQVPMKWEWKQRRGESMLYYAHRFQQIKNTLAGKVINVINEIDNGFRKNNW